ncbi:unnamed protein product [Ceutorhynchus assimilis]|uniref:Cytochrome P450 n=1 Tax=Ceutorhynchus assimilis TaxID=467358 RepID=A0A9N9QK17_9CUCU|nr:unnamed protein product [Ceutorhynchus assimilis]
MSAVVGTEILAAPASFVPNLFVTVLFGTVTLLAIYHFWFQSLHYVKLSKNIPGPTPLPFVGNALMAIGVSPIEIMQKVLDIHKELKSDVAKIYIGPKLYIGLTDPRDVELILGSHVHLEKSWEYKLFEPWLGEGLLISKGDKWRTHRKMIAPTFHSSILKSFMPVFNKNALSLLNQLEKVKGQIFDVHDYMSGTTVDILLETAMGVKKTEEDNTGFEYAKAVMDMCNILHLRHYKVWLRPAFIFKWTKMASEQIKFLEIIHSLTRKVIKRKKEDYFVRVSAGEASLYKEAVKAEEANNKVNEKTENYKYIRDDLEDIEENDIGEKKRLAFLDFMIEASQTKGNKLTDEEIKEEVDTIMFEGHDTTAAGSSFVLSLLGIYEHIQNKCIAELQEIFHDDWHRPITFSDTLQMKYLERVIMETLRLYPPVPVISRQINEDIKLVSANYTVPAKATVLISQYLTHRHPKYWKNPTVFDPDNFLPENCQERHYYAYFPFSAGPRSCVGRKYAMLKLKVILASILRRYIIISTKKEEDFRLQGDIILKRADGFCVRMEERVLS